MKKLLFILVCGLFALYGEARDFQYTYEGQTLTYTVVGERAMTCETKGNFFSSEPGNSVSGDLIIPAIAKDGDKEYSVINISTHAFYRCDELTSVSIPNSVTSIDYEAFYNCTSLKSATIGTSVKTIGNGAFSQCSALTSVAIPNSVTSIGESAFANCFSLTSLNIPSSVTSIGHSAFSYCTGLTSVRIPDSITLIDASTFSHCGSLASVTIPESVTAIGDYAFTYCIGLTSITIPESVTAIGKHAFNGCRALNSLIIPGSITAIGEGVFKGCSGLTSLTIPESITSIGDCAFSECTGLTSLTIPESVTSIGNFAFSGCSGLTSLTIPGSITSIGYGAFSECTGLTSIIIPDSVTSIDDYAFSGCTSLKVVTIGNAVVSIGSYAFDGCRALTSITIGKSVSKIGEKAFTGCKAISELHVLATIPPTLKYSFSNDTYSKCLVYVPNESLKQYRNSWSDFTFLLPSSIPDEYVTYHVETPGNLVNLISIDELENIFKLKLSGKLNGTDLLCLNKMSEVLYLDLSDATIVSGGMPYYEADNERFNTTDNMLSKFWAYNLEYLIEVNLPQNLVEIGESAFEGKKRLRRVTIPEAVASIGRAAFDGCSGLTSVTIPNAVTSIGYKTFNGCSSLTSVIIPNAVISIDNYAFSDCCSLISVTIPESVTSIGSYAFNGCKSLASVTIPNAVTSISSYAFNGCKSLTSVIIPPSVTAIGNGIFADCSRLIKSAYPSTLPNPFFFTGTAIAYNPKGSIIEDGFVFGPDKNAIYFAPLSLQGEYVIPGSVKSVGDHAFYECDSLTSVKIPGSVTSIGNDAFNSCSGLTSIAIPESVSTIGNATFIFCSALASANIPETVTSIGECAFYRTALSSITLPGSLREIGAQAFDGCESLGTVNVINPIPPVIEDNTFGVCPATATLYVPEGSKNIYWLHPYWGKFANINTLNGGSENLFTMGEITYHITSVENATVEISVAQSARSSVEAIKIPAEISYNGKSYRVAGVANNGFIECSVRELYLPSTIGYIGLQAFTGCSELSKLTCDAVVPPSIDVNSFDEAAYQRISLMVPEESVDAYKNHDVWSKFTSCIPNPDSGIDDVTAIGPDTFTVFNLQGVRLDISTYEELSRLPSGVYIVNGKKMYLK